MRKLILFNMVSADGYFEGPEKNLDWHQADAEFSLFAIEQLKECGPLLFGRKTYELMQRHWTTHTAMQNDPIVASEMNSKTKYVVSKTLTNSDWDNTIFLNDFLADAIMDLKQQPGRDIMLFGSANLAFTFRELRLIDEYRVMVNPVFLGSGTPLFRHAEDCIGLTLLRAQTFHSGNVLLCYGVKEI